MTTPPTNTFGGLIRQSAPLSVGGLSNVWTIGAADGSVLVYNSTNGRWEQAVNALNTDSAHGGAGAHTLVVADLSRGFIDHDPEGSTALTTPTAEEIVGAFPTKPVGFTLQLYIRNTADAAETLTLTGGTGVTVSGDAGIGQNESMLVLFRLDNVSAGTEAVSANIMFAGTWNA